MIRPHKIEDRTAGSSETGNSEKTSIHLNLLDLSAPENPKALPPPALETMMKVAAEQPSKNENQQTADELRNYPELALSRQATEAFSDTQISNPVQRWNTSNKLFHQAELALERYIEGQGGVAKMYVNAKPFLSEIQNAVEQFKQGKRHLNVADSAQKVEQEKQLQERIKDFSAQDTLAGIRGERGADLQASLKQILNSDEKDSLDDLDFILNKIQLVASLRVQHSLLANQYANANNDENAKILSEEILKGIAATDPDTFRTSPEIHGLILQNQLGQPMDLSGGKAIALAFTDEAERTIAATQSPAAALLSNEERQNGANQSLRLLLAALATNEQTTLDAWERWPAANQYRYFIDKAKLIHSGQTKQSNHMRLA